MHAPLSRGARSGANRVLIVGSTFGLRPDKEVGRCRLYCSPGAALVCGLDWSVVSTNGITGEEDGESKIRINVHLEFLVRPIRGPGLELASMDLKNQRPRSCRLSRSPSLSVALRSRNRHLEAEDGVLLRHSLDLVLDRDDLKREFRVLDDDACDAHSADTATSHHGEQRAVEISTGEHGSGTRGRQQSPPRSLLPLQPQNFLDVGTPHVMQRLEDGIFPLLLW